MKGKKKGISSILGALIFLQILLISLLLVIHVINNETNITLKSVQRFQALSENTPIEEEVENNITYLYSTTPFVITHIIYPNEEIVNTSIMVNGHYPVSQVLNGFPWAIIVTNKGTWYNVTPLGGSNYNSGLIIFPYYHDYGMPLDPSVLNVTDISNWNVLEGITSPSALSLVPVNVTIEDPITYRWALTDAVLVVYPNSSSGWINITYYDPNIESKSYFVPDYNLPPGSVIGWTKYYIYARLGIYIPINITIGLESCCSNKPYQINESTLEYVYIYDQDYEITDEILYVLTNLVGNNVVAVNEGGGWAYPAIGSVGGVIPTLVYFPAYFLSHPIPNELTNELISNISLPPNESFENTSPPWYRIPEHIYNYTTVFQTDINLYKGVVLNYAYDPLNNSWILLENLTINYNDQELYSKANIIYATNQGLMKLTNIYSIQYLTMYPIYIVIPQGVYVLQVSLS